jgi:hypothetical protein
MEDSRIAKSAQDSEMPSSLHPDQLFNALPRSWLGRFVFLLLCLLAWFAFQFPLVPTTALGFAVNVSFALLVIGYGVLALRSIVWLSETRFNRNVKSVLGFILAASVGVVIFIAAYLSRDFLSTNFGFHHIRELFH